jgi:hydroxymethylpyrimidine kinase / phosphomethylpyrimidine kinase / thiamine-phosphate diphosphorylase
MPTKSHPIAWSIAGSDSSGGAGIQADLKTFQALGVHGCTVITAITAQNSRAVERAIPVPNDVLEAQMRALDKDLPPAIIKTGMLPGAGSVRTVAKFAQGNRVPLVTDPVAISSSGVHLIDSAGWEALTNRLLPLVSVLTPNLAETAKLSRFPTITPENMDAAATRILELGCHSVLIKGGHVEGSHCMDFWSDGTNRLWMRSPRMHVGEVHGTGCVLASALAACLAHRNDVADALVTAKTFINRSLRNALPIGRGSSFMSLPPPTGIPSDLPTLHDGQRPGSGNQLRFNPLPEPRHSRVYPIAESADHVERLLIAGVELVQLRLKNRPQADASSEIARAVALARQYQAMVIINDHWRLALEHGATGVHLGQDDLPDADIAAIHNAGLLLGISTHSHIELARALAYHPSYVAIGTVFPTTSKTLTWNPLGRERFAALAALSPVPVVAIGGIASSRAAPLFTSGADWCAVISDLDGSRPLEPRVHEWRTVSSCHIPRFAPMPEAPS